MNVRDSGQERGGPMKRLRVAVLGGGASPEHDVSLRSAEAVRRALSARGHHVLQVSIDRRGYWRIHDQLRPPLTALAGLLDFGVDVVFPALHGRGGEDGSVQALLDAAGLPYAFSGARASAIGMSKALSRAAFVGAGLPMAKALTPSRAETRGMHADELAVRIAEAGLEYPLFLKEEDSGSSLGVERIEGASELPRALAAVRELGSHWILEEGVEGIEMTVAVLGNAGGAAQAAQTNCALLALPPVEIRPKTAQFFDYDAKYDASATDELCPAPSLDARGRAMVEDLACRAHDLLGCRGLSRSDMIWTGERAVLLETNTIPGLTDESLVPKAAAAAGMSFADLAERLLEIALLDAKPGARPGPNSAESEDSHETRASPLSQAMQSPKMRE